MPGLKQHLPFLFLSLLWVSCSDTTDDTFTIRMSGGYWRGGINPENTAYTVISNGELTRTITYLYSDSQVEHFRASPADVNALHEYMVDNGFDTMDEYFDCAAGDTLCESFKTTYPPANPLTLELEEYGRNRIVTITVYGLTEIPVIQYPAAIDTIVIRILDLFRE
ncbi:MAG: hypothetical protein ACE5D8_09515 [Fidelibacterota bacterium]